MESIVKVILGVFLLGAGAVITKEGWKEIAKA